MLWISFVGSELWDDWIAQGIPTSCSAKALNASPCAHDQSAAALCRSPARHLALRVSSCRRCSHFILPQQVDKVQCAGTAVPKQMQPEETSQLLIFLCLGIIIGLAECGWLCVNPPPLPFKKQERPGSWWCRNECGRTIRLLWSLQTEDRRMQTKLQNKEKTERAPAR